MCAWPRQRRRPFRPGYARHGVRPHHPTLEALEDRCLLAGGYVQINLASDLPGLAPVTDPNLVNPWGISSSPTGPFWFANNGTGTSSLLDGEGGVVPLVVTVPSAAGSVGSPTGTVFNGGPGFAITANGWTAPSRFLFATEDGTIAGWTSEVDETRALLAVDNSSAGASYKGLALASDPAGHSFLYAADFGRGQIDVFDEAFQPVTRPGAFQDPNLPAGFAPFNIQNIDGQLFVTYALRDKAEPNNVPGAGHGFVDLFDADGQLVRRFASGGALDSPWGLAQAPADFGPLGGALLVGNTGDGRINAFDPNSGAFLGPLVDGDGVPITRPDLWALTFGNDHAGGAADTLFFAEGLDDEAHGLVGAIQTANRKGAGTAGPGLFDPNAPGEPGDYPLPPFGGPALQADGDGRPIPVSVLIPLSESSLALAPTLSTVPESNTRGTTSVSADRVLAALAGNGVQNALILTVADTTAGKPSVIPSGGAPGLLAFNPSLNPSVSPSPIGARSAVSQLSGATGSGSDTPGLPEDARRDSPLALNTFLDLSTAVVVTRKGGVERQLPDSYPGPAGDGITGAEAPLAETISGRLMVEIRDVRPTVATGRLATRMGEHNPSGGPRWAKLLGFLATATGLSLAWNYLQVDKTGPNYLRVRRSTSKKNLS
jgi:uncharacterized protein (TIGR03118 family)